MKNRRLLNSLGTSLLALPIAVSLALAPVASAQTYTPAPPERAQAQAEFSQQELDQMLAPIALYPDSLLSQILMAATYPLEVVQAARWSRANPGLQGDRAVGAVAQQDWDPSVKSLAAFPQILAMMDAKLEWTERLGNAFLAQEPQVMDSVQNLRQRAYAAGNLRSDDQIRVVPQGPVIVVEPANPQVVYVPYYDPTVVYGSWWWPAPPVYWAPWRDYHAPRPGFFFSWGAGIPVASGFFFGAFDWPRRHTRVVSVNNYYYNRNTARKPGARVDEHKAEAARRAKTRQETRPESRKAPPAVRAAPPTAQPRVEQHAARPVPGFAPQPRAESAVRLAPAAPAPQSRMEAPRARAPGTAHPAANAQEPRHGRGGEPRGGGREPQR